MLTRFAATVFVRAAKRNLLAERTGLGKSVSVSLRNRPTQSVMYVPLLVNRFAESVLLIVQYRYLKSCSGDFNSPESDPPHKIMRYWIYYTQSGWVFHFHLTESVRWK